MSPTRSVDNFYDIGTKLGAIYEGAPGVRLEVHDNFYACYIRDLDGNKIVAACHERTIENETLKK